MQGILIPISVWSLLHVGLIMGHDLVRLWKMGIIENEGKICMGVLRALQEKQLLMPRKSKLDISYMSFCK